MKYIATILAFIAAAFGLSWLAVYSFWFSAQFFRSVPAVRICDAIGAVILFPVRTLFWLKPGIFGASMPLSDPTTYALINAVLLGILAYALCRHRMFGKHDRW